ncbi:hypothetical protein ACFE04_021024 [Oxalis oulophora]
MESFGHAHTRWWTSRHVEWTTVEVDRMWYWCDVVVSSLMVEEQGGVETNECVEDLVPSASKSSNDDSQPRDMSSKFTPYIEQNVAYPGDYIFLSTTTGKRGTVNEGYFANGISGLKSNQ